jgi:DNA-binding MarR family transcriptional regulator
MILITLTDTESRWPKRWKMFFYYHQFMRYFKYDALKQTAHKMAKKVKNELNQDQDHRLLLESLPRHLIEISHWAIENMLDRVKLLGHTGLRHAHEKVLRPLTPSGNRLVDVAREAGVSKNAIGQLANELEEMGYIERVPDATDARAKNLRHTNKGLQLQKDVITASEEFNEQMVEMLGKRKTEQLTKLMAELSTAIRDQHKPNNT